MDVRHGRGSAAVVHKRCSYKNATVAFLYHITPKTADKFPDTYDAHLPLHTKKEVYEIFLFDFEVIHGATTAPSTKAYFLATWRNTCKHIKFIKTGLLCICPTYEQLSSSLAFCARTNWGLPSCILRRRHMSRRLPESAAHTNAERRTPCEI